MTKKFLRLNGYQWTCILYVAVAVFCWQLKYFRHIDNNYLIFRQSYYHAKAHLNLYQHYPAEYYDVFLYGPLFTFFVAPFAVLPEVVGFFFWEVFNAAAFLLAVHLLPFNNRIKTAILLLCVVEFANSVHYMQFNPVIAALIILSFIMVKKEKDHWATLLTIFGAFMKVYPIAGLAFFVFSKHKGKFIGWGLFWIVVCLCLPALISGPGFLLQSYRDWFDALSAKNLLNESLTSGQDWCVMGVVRRLTQNAALPNWPFLLGGAVVFGLPLLRFEQYRSLKFQLQVMCSVLLMVVIFSTGSEHPTFIIATAGAVIYIMMQPRPFTSFNIVFLILLIVITGLGPSDAFPHFMRDWMQSLAMKAWPCIAIWCKITYELLFKDFNTEQEPLGIDSTGEDTPGLTVAV
ncbi:glycosyltransferase family 87 protein [Mucilaginibacter gynuensis]|uniref:glycosyltransferase family 87 protein n=1 Tax=Mucilaginibacter gynuensis TaxID=1302236 RepID=UPI0031E78854